jgi:long-chain acyl-CoA synthetase
LASVTDIPDANHSLSTELKKIREVVMENTVAGLFKERVSKTPDKPALSYKEGTEWKTITWQHYSDRVDEFARSLMALGVKPRDKVALIGSNTPEWFYADMGIMTMGAATVPVYGTNSGDQIIYILNHSESKVFVMDDIAYFQRIQDRLSEIPALKNIVLLKGPLPETKGPILLLNQFLVLKERTPMEDLQKMRKQIKPEDVDTLLYTSGTTGQPKAVMLTNLNSTTAGKNVDLTMNLKNVQITSPCYLPLSHVAERTVNLFYALYSGHITYFLGGYDKFKESLAEIRPTMWMGVPRVWEKLYEGVMGYRASLPDNKKKMIDWALSVGSDYNQRKYKKESISVILAAKYLVARSLVIKKLLRALGLDRAIVFVTGGAPTHVETLNFYISIGIWLQDVYGQTEGHGTTSFALRGDVRFGSAGKPYPLTKVELAPDGEILVKGDHVSPGYYKDPELTKETFKDGWLYSGDLGRFDEDGFLWVTGRKKDIIITSGGKNITPSKIESMLLGLPMIENAVVVGDARKYLTSLLILSEESVKKFAAEKGLTGSTYAEIVQNDEVKNEISRHIDLMNEKLSRVEQIKGFKILSQPFSQEGGELTPTMKVKRFVIQNKYATEIEDMYR